MVENLKSVCNLCITVPAVDLTVFLRLCVAVLLKRLRMFGSHKFISSAQTRPHTNQLLLQNRSKHADTHNNSMHTENYSC